MGAWFFPIGLSKKLPQQGTTMFTQPINVSSGYTAPVKKTNNNRNVGTVGDSSNVIRFASYAMIATAVVLVAHKALAIVG